MKYALRILGDITVLAVTLFFSPLDVEACGTDWSVPRSHFDGVNEQGFALFVDTIGALQVSEDFQLPIRLIFRSDWNSRSPYAGSGFLVPLLESRIEQLDDNTFRMWQPSGWYLLFWRSKENPNILNGQSGWKAEIQKDMITVWADCGWKLSYLKGKIVGMDTPPKKGHGLSKGHKLDFMYMNDRVASVRVDAVEKLSVEFDSSSGEPKALSLNGKRIGIEFGQKPRVQNINGQNLLGGMDRSLNKLTFADGTAKTYEFGVNDKLQPTLKVGDRLITWDPQNRRILKDGDLTYEIKADEKNLFANAEIKRTNGKGESNYWFDDRARGTEIVEENGVRKIFSRFTTGKVSGKIRRIEERQGDTVKAMYKASYDEKGRLIREIEEGYAKTSKIRSFNYDAEGRVASIQYDGDQFVSAIQYAANGNVQRTINSKEK